MSRDATAAAAAQWTDAALAAALFAVDPAGTGGMHLRALAGPVRERWLALLAELLGPATPLRRVPLHITDERLLGGLDLAATLRAGRPVAGRGVLAAADGGAVVLAMAERLTSTTVARVTAVLDTGEVRLERDGLTLRAPARIGVIALDEGIGDDPPVSAALVDRLAFAPDLAALRAADAGAAWHCAAEIAAARALLPSTSASAEIIAALCTAAHALGIASIRAPMLALAAARAAAALDGRCEVDADDATLAARLVLAPRATVLPVPPESAEDDARDDPIVPEPPPASADSPTETRDATEVQPLDDVVLAAAQAAIPAGLLALLQAGADRSARARGAGRVGAQRQSGLRGRPSGVRRGEPRPGSRLNVVETLRAAAPWQRLRRQMLDGATSPACRSSRIEVRPEDFHVSRFKQRSETTTVFVVDASGSAALHRLAETKGAVELLLADCYVRRDRVAVIAFRGAAAEVLLPPTRSLVRAKRCLASLAGGGGTPLAAGIDAAAALAGAILRRGGTPAVVVLTDGRANIARDGSPGRTRAGDDALAAARTLRGTRVAALLVDTSPQPQAQAEHLALAMGARYLALPHADARMLSGAVRAAAAAPQ